MAEEWRQIEEFPLYDVSNYGNVRYSATGYVKKLSLINGGYLCANVEKNSKYYKKPVHSLVAKAFLPNPEDKTAVTHIDKNRANNNVDNLKWVSRKTTYNNIRKINQPQIFDV